MPSLIPSFGKSPLEATARLLLQSLRPDDASPSATTAAAAAIPLSGGVLRLELQLPLLALSVADSSGGGGGGGWETGGGAPA